MQACESNHFPDEASKKRLPRSSIDLAIATIKHLLPRPTTDETAAKTQHRRCRCRQRDLLSRHHDKHSITSLLRGSKKDNRAFVTSCQQHVNANDDQARSCCKVPSQATAAIVPSNEEATATTHWREKTLLRPTTKTVAATERIYHPDVITNQQCKQTTAPSHAATVNVAAAWEQGGKPRHNDEMPTTRQRQRRSSKALM